jgi:CBS domain-containing protein
MTTTMVGPYSAVSDLLPATVVCIGGDRTLRDAAMIMREANVSSALVDDGTSIVTERDITAAVAVGCDARTPIRTVAVRDPVTVSASATVLAAAAEMINRDIRHLVVTDGAAVVGVISLRPLVKVLVHAMDPGVWVMLRQAVAAHTEVWIG